MFLHGYKTKLNRKLKTQNQDETNELIIYLVGGMNTQKVYFK